MNTDPTLTGAGVPTQRKRAIGHLLIQEPPLQVLPSLACRIGLNEAIVLQQLYYLLRNPEFGRKIAEHKWIFNTVEEWRCRYFPFWSNRTIKTIFASLKRQNLILTCQPEGRASRRKYYRINTEGLSELPEGAEVAPSMGQILPDGVGKNRPFPYSKTTSKTTKQRKDKGATALHSSFSPRFEYPLDEEEMYEVLESEGVEIDRDRDGRFFDQMEASNWTIRGEPVYDWVATYRARIEKSNTF